ncbi:hypothetical protein PG990_009835 [Apiospora arundinis]
MVAGQNLGPLTTAAALPSTCANELDEIYKINTPPGYYLIQGPPDGASCYPSAYAGVISQYYSPAASCPFGFTPACTSTNEATETVYTCCPTQFDYKCQSTSFYQWESTLGCVASIISSRTTTWTVLDVENGKTVATTSVGYQGGANAFSVQVRFQSSDLITSGQTSPAGSTQTPTFAPSTEAAGASTGSGLSSGAVAGIGVGAAILFIAIAGAIIMMFRRRKRQKQLRQPAVQLAPDSYYSTLAAPKYGPEMETMPQKIHEAPNFTYELEGAAPRR